MATIVRCAFWILISSVTSTAAQSLTLSSDKPVYTVGETIKLSVVGSPGGGYDQEIFGRLLYDPSLTETVSSKQTPMEGEFGLPWTSGFLQTADGFADVFNQITFLDGPANCCLLAEAVLTAEAPGNVEVTWLEGGTAGLDFFGITSSPGLTFEIAACPDDIDCDGVLDGDDGCASDPAKSDAGVCGCFVPDEDADGDAIEDCNDECPADPEKTTAGVCGCGHAESLDDSDGDAVVDCLDACPDDPDKSEPGWSGCGNPEGTPGIELRWTHHSGGGPVGSPDTTASDGDALRLAVFVRHLDGLVLEDLWLRWVPGSLDATSARTCPEGDDPSSSGTCDPGPPYGDEQMAFTQAGFDNAAGEAGRFAAGKFNPPYPKEVRLGEVRFEKAGATGAMVEVFYTPGGGVDDPNGGHYQPTARAVVNDGDSDGDGLSDDDDLCPGDPGKGDAAGVCGCGVAEADSDGDGLFDCEDDCPADPDKSDAGACGCGYADSFVDTDGDLSLDCVDGCSRDPRKTDPGECGCGTPDEDSDGDGALDCQDRCPSDAGKTDPGGCGCGAEDRDTDGDGALDCVDDCPVDPQKTAPGVCGCGTLDVDSDDDGLLDCEEGCPFDAAKTEAGICGCGVPDTDSDGDGLADCEAPTAAGDEFLVNTTAFGHQAAPAVDHDGRGGFVIAWQSSATSQDGDGTGIYARRYDPQGAPVGGEFLVNDTTSGNQEWPSVYADASGGFVVAYHQRAGGQRANVRARRFDAAGSPLGGSVDLDTFSSHERRYPSVDGDAEGNFVAVWEPWSQDGEGSGVVGRRFDAAGGPRGAEFIVNTTHSGNQTRGRVAASPGGDFVVVWTAEGDLDGDATGIFGQLYDASGLRIGSEFQVNQTTDGQQKLPAVCMDPLGRFVVSWRDVGAKAYYARRFEASGAAAGDEFRVSESPVEDTTSSSGVACDGDGNVVVVWDASGDVQMHWFDVEGASRGGEIEINQGSPSALKPSVSIDAQGGFVVVWTKWLSGINPGREVYARRFLPPISPAPTP